MNNLGALVRRMREDQGWTGKEFAERIGRDASYVSRLETGRMKETPAPSDLESIGAVLSVSVEDLLKAAGYKIGTSGYGDIPIAERAIMREVRAHEWTPAQVRAAVGSLRAIAQMGKEG